MRAGSLHLDPHAHLSLFRGEGPPPEAGCTAAVGAESALPPLPPLPPLLLGRLGRCCFCCFAFWASSIATTPVCFTGSSGGAGRSSSSKPMPLSMNGELPKRSAQRMLMQFVWPSSNCSLPWSIYSGAREEADG